MSATVTDRDRGLDRRPPPIRTEARAAAAATGGPTQSRCYQTSVIFPRFARRRPELAEKLYIIDMITTVEYQLQAYVCNGLLGGESLRLYS